MSNEDTDKEPIIPSTRAALETRVALVERDVRAHARSITSLVENDQRQEIAIQGLEDWKMNRLLVEAREEERDKSLYGRLERIEASIASGIAAVSSEVKGIKGNFSRAFWIAMGTLIPAVILGAALVIVFGVRMIPS